MTMRKHYPALPRDSQGFALLVALIALISLTLASIALVRSIDTGSLVLGNLGFKQATILYTDRGSETAISWLLANNNGSTLNVDIPAQGYYATSLDGLDPTGQQNPSWQSGSPSTPTRVLVEWDDDGSSSTCAGQSNYTSCITPAPAITVDNSYSVTYIISRVCSTTGDANSLGNECSKSVTQSSASQSQSRGKIDYIDTTRFSTPSGPYFRIISRSRGPRGTVSFAETVVYF